MAGGNFSARKMTMKKSRRIASMDTVLERGAQHRSGRPPMGKTWVKQIFAGQNEAPQHNMGMETEDSYVTAITHPPQGRKGDGNRVQPEEQRPVLRIVDRIVRDHTQANANGYAATQWVLGVSLLTEEGEVAQIRTDTDLQVISTNQSRGQLADRIVG